MSLKNWLLGIVRLGEFIPGQTYTPLDGLVQVHSTEAVEDFFGHSLGAQAIGDASPKFVDDPEGQLSLKKRILPCSKIVHEYTLLNRMRQNDTVSAG